MHIDQLPKHTTVESLRAELNRRKPFTDAIGAAMRRGDMVAMAAAQEAMRKAFSQ
jgi:hypothetical protein